jgi:ABC-type nitrate/sulfonate/bicarbonate transport system substrate-binding protein
MGCDDSEQEEKKKARAKLPKLSLQSPWVNDAEFIGYFVAIDKGYYDEEKINFEYIPGSPDINAGVMLLGNRCDIALTNLDGTANSIVRDKAPLKVIGAQYQRSPLGIVTLKENGITAPKDLVGKTIAVPDANIPTTQAFLRLNAIRLEQVRIVPYQYDPGPLINGSVDATVDFVTNVPYSIRLRGKEPSSFLFYDFGFKMFMDTVVVTERVLRDKPKELVAFLRASRKGWEENFKNAATFPATFRSSWFKDNGRDEDNERYFNERQKPLIEASAGIFSMSEQDIQDNLSSLKEIGLEIPPTTFDTSLLRDV